MVLCWCVTVKWQKSYMFNKWVTILVLVLDWYFGSPEIDHGWCNGSGCLLSPGWPGSSRSRHGGWLQQITGPCHLSLPCWGQETAQVLLMLLANFLNIFFLKLKHGFVNSFLQIKMFSIKDWYFTMKLKYSHVFW